MNIRRTMSIMLAVALASWATTMRCQAQTDASVQPTAPQMLAHRLTLLARQSLVSTDQAQPQAAQLTRARLLLEQADALDGTDAERWLLTAEAQRLCGNTDAQTEALKQYVKLTPTDDAAQLRLIDLLAARQQTADLRLAFLMKIAEGPASASFGAPLRSRVAYRAALLAAEQGRPDEYGRLLTTALQLDSTDKPAAAESLRVLTTSSSSTPQERAAAMLALFQADPADPLTHAAIGRMLMSMAQYSDAADWFADAAQIDSVQRRTGSVTLLNEWALTLWAAGRGADAIALLAQLDPPAPDEAQAGGAAEAKPVENPNWPPLDSLMLRAAIACDNAPTDDASAAAFKRVSDRFNAALEKDPKNASLLAGLAWAQLICNRDTDKTAALLDQLQLQPDAANMQLPLMRGWLAMRTGNAADTQKLLEPLAADDPRAAVGLATMPLQADDSTAIKKWLTQAVLQSPTDIFGVIAAGQLRRLSMPLPEPTGAKDVASVFNSVPGALRRMATEPMRYVQVRLNCPSLRYDFGQPIPAGLEIRNVSLYPLSMEPGGPIPTRLFILPSVNIDQQPGPALPPMVMDVGRRLKLDPMRSMSVPIRLDAGAVGLLTTAAAWSRVQIDATAILNPVVAPGGTFTPGMLGSAAYVRNLVRRNIAMTKQAIQQQIAQLGSSDPAASMRAMAMLIAALPADENATPEQTELKADVIAGLKAAWAGASPIQQAYMVSLIPVNEQVAQQMQPILSEAAVSQQPLVQLMLLTTQVHKADDPLLNAGLRNGDMIVRVFAEATRTVLASGTPAPGTPGSGNQAPKTAPDGE